jgi:cyanophycinase
MTQPGGPLALVGGAEWTEGCDFDAELLAASGGDEVVVLPTAAAYELPDQVVERARSWFGGLGGRVVAVPALDRAGAHDEANVAAVRRARFVYLSGGSAMHLLSVLKRTPLWDAVLAARADGAVVAAAGPSASVLCDAMVDPRGGGFGVGLGLVDELSLIPRYEQWSAEKSRRTIELAPKGLVLAGLPARTALIFGGPAGWRVAGHGEVRLFRDGQPIELSSLRSA